VSEADVMSSTIVGLASTYGWFGLDTSRVPEWTEKLRASVARLNRLRRELEALAREDT